MNKTIYYQKLKDPRWQKLRLQVLERAEWKCQLCGTAHHTLHVHHLEYADEPWGVAVDKLECLCEQCHEWREQFNRLFYVAIRRISTKKANEMALRLPEDPALGEAIYDALMRLPVRDDLGI